jgi:hypothetical protein
MIDLDPLVSQAWEGKPAALVHELNRMLARIVATEGRQMVMADLPESAQKFFTAIGSVQRTSGRPSKANAEILAVQRAYYRAAARFAFEQKRAFISFAKSTGARELIGRTDYPMQDIKPANYALQDMAETSGLSEGALLDLIYPDRHKKTK